MRILTIGISGRFEGGGLRFFKLGNELLWRVFVLMKGVGG